MASLIYLGDLMGQQRDMVLAYWNGELKSSFRGSGLKAVIAKGNIIEGIEART